MNKVISIFVFLFLPGLAVASSATETLNLTNHAVGYAALAIFAIAYLLVMSEELPIYVNQNRSFLPRVLSGL